MPVKEDFDFLNSDVWIKYTQDRYLSLGDIKYRLDKLGISKQDWPRLKKKIQQFRKMGAVPFFLDSIHKKFWFFPSDSINKKIHKIESLGNKLYDQIENCNSFKKDFLINSTIEEAITSAIYEGANSTRAQAKSLIASNSKPHNKDEWMLMNNYKAMNWIKSHLNIPTSNELILKIHEIISKNTLEGDDAHFCGKFRDDKIFVGQHEGVTHTKIKETLQEVIHIISKHPRFLHSLIKGIAFHYFIAYIHPFFDGNGRTARTLFYFEMIKTNLKFIELLSISANLKNQGEKYSQSFDLVKEHELDMTFFIDFCLDSLSTALEKVENKVSYLININHLKETEKLNTNQIALLQKGALNKYKTIQINEYAQNIKRSREIARKELKDLFKKGFLKEEKQGKKHVYKIDNRYLKKKVSTK